MNTALLAAAGKGTRYFGYPSDIGKSHITLYDKRLFEYLVPPLRLVGIEKLVIHANKGCERNFRCFETFFQVVIYTEPNFPEVTHIPYAWEDRLPEQYFFLFGHQPVHSDHLANQDKVTDGGSMGASVYPDYKESEKLPVILKDNYGVEFAENGLENNVNYIGPPWIVLGSVFARLARDDNFKHWSGYYIKKSHQEGTRVSGVQAEMPPEFDFPWQFPSVEQFLAKYLINP